MLSTVLSLKNLQTPFYHFCRKKIEKLSISCFFQLADWIVSDSNKAGKMQ
ncbi:hypothetical protein BSUW23_20180 [Bacillus spizizenii str. W23]|uniref:Uncharacterized protein n=1 Tax=Bacillus spizizenii (strain ATCC 23059 / NRRL B-14472 / W23) TaxID=655816 RepID=E0TZB9_BACSH|nr:hypothetical protein BSUW23_20180 [Bacillus spizizenii str. W23]AJW85487.1 hypothetical protein BIS30_10090 [Bacillus spizizenii]EFG93885.1 hypothetical protein BSU6633_02674 [Bacillus spizizenii ATCC 6633 = JCM 2499]